MIGTHPQGNVIQGSPHHTLRSVLRRTELMELLLLRSGLLHQRMLPNHPAQLLEVRGAVILPQRSRHPSQLIWMNACRRFPNLFTACADMATQQWWIQYMGAITTRCCSCTRITARNSISRLTHDCTHCVHKYL